MKNKKVYILSLCVKRRQDQWHEFHFKGYYNGKKVKRLMVKGGAFVPLEEYIIKARVKDFREGDLFCKCLKSRPIFNR